MQDFHVICMKQNQFKYDLILNLTQHADIFTACHTFIRNKCHFLDHVFMATQINQINMTDVTSGAATAHPSEAPEFTPGFQCGSCYSNFSSSITSFPFVNKRANYPFGIMSLAHAPMNMTDISIGSINFVRHIPQT